MSVSVCSDPLVVLVSVWYGRHALHMHVFCRQLRRAVWIALLCSVWAGALEWTPKGVGFLSLGCEVEHVSLSIT